MEKVLIRERPLSFYLKNLSRLRKIDTADLQSASDRFPYNPHLHLLLAIKNHLDQGMIDNDKLEKAALYLSDRTKLAEWVNKLSGYRVHADTVDSHGEAATIEEPPDTKDAIQWPTESLVSDQEEYEPDTEGISIETADHLLPIDELSDEEVIEIQEEGIENEPDMDFDDLESDKERIEKPGEQTIEVGTGEESVEEEQEVIDETHEAIREEEASQGELREGIETITADSDVEPEYRQSVPSGSDLDQVQVEDPLKESDDSEERKSRIKKKKKKKLKKKRKKKKKSGTRLERVLGVELSKKDHDALTPPMPHVTSEDSQLSPFIQWLASLGDTPSEGYHDLEAEMRLSKDPSKPRKKAHAKKRKKKKAKKKLKKSKRHRPSLAENEAIVSETLAELLASQGYTRKAIDMYEKLRLINPEKSTLFAQKIEALESKEK